MLSVNTSHFEFAQSLTCDCYLCSKWRRWTETLKKAEKATKGHFQGCSCKLCKLLLSTRKATLAAELRLDLWIELGFYAYLENWNSGWEKLAWKEINQTDRDWIVKYQYFPIDYWLEKFKDFGAKEGELYNYNEYFPNF